MTDNCAPLNGCIEALARLRDAIATMDPEIYAGPVNGHAAIGEHVRHTLDHFECFCRDLDSAQLDYDARSRDRETECDRDRAIALLDSTIESLRALNIKDVDAPIDVRHTCAPGAEPTITKSSIGRELAFLSSHAVHHLAIIALMSEAHGRELDPDSTLAFSTQAYRRASE